ncbi:N-acetylglucosamine 6-phosphate deacetylase [Seinonella peptonophila]|uniref:N-acetylglucosamine-6-phosphate deacetylase n=1 Tax=Seinonella peptonophila TaxID=112248 RepID=A0A1M4VM45_9BACL|nr:N-acetylglucosamine-6-phosphate deacetylase [Seinonella peptonophila]SHE70141.1 N-acetylglucosamine 6-phosphate deacetylase [Seinonella peptonophila]
MDNQRFILSGAQIVTDKQILKQGYIEIEAGQIKRYGQQQQLPTDQSVPQIKLPAHYMVVPGMIDVHIHGAAGSDVMDGTMEALTTMATALPKEGTTAFLATTITQESAAIDQALENAADYIEQQPHSGLAECVGIHLEGPFISKERAGAQPLEYILSPHVDSFMKWQEKARQQIKLVTLAPEEGEGLELISYLQQTGVIASIGHSNASYAEVRQAVEHGATHVTHLFNGMRGLHHREPGVVGGALLSPELMVEMIVDGIHARSEMIDFAYRLLTSKRAILITDAMRAKCLKPGIYDLGGQDVQVSNESARLADGTLAGSILKMDQALRNIIHFTGCSLLEAVQMASQNAAKELGLDRKGSITEGKDADLVVLNDQYEIVQTYCRGELAFEKTVE